MKKVLIISYFYPPGNFAGSYRVASWAEHFHEHGIYPVIITRHWDEGQSGFSDIPNRNDIRIERTGKAEIHYLPYRGNLRDKILRRGRDKYSFIRRALSFTELLLQNYFTFIIPFRNLYYYSKKILEEEGETEIVIISATPFVLFRFGYLLKKRFARIKWIADYRDMWTTDTFVNRSKNSLLKHIERRSEIKWLSGAAAIISTSETWCDELAKLTGCKTYTVYNGYDRELAAAALDETIRRRNDLFTLGYNGTLTGMQNADVILNAIKQLIESGRQKIKICFWGIGSDPLQAARVHERIKGYEEYFDLTVRLGKDDLNRRLLSADMFILFGVTELRGCYLVKLFDYLISGKPILISPSGEDLMEALIMETHSGHVCKTEKDTFNKLAEMYDEFHRDGSLTYHGDQEKIKLYSRQQQAGVLARIIHSL